MLWSLAWKELKHNKFFTLLFLINISIGLVGLVVIENFKVSFQEVLDGKAQKLLGADLSISGRFPLTDEQRGKVENYFSQRGEDKTLIRESLGLFSMGRGEKGGRLISLSSMDINATKEGEIFPFYGGLELDNGETYPITTQTPPEKGTVWVYPDVIKLLGISESKEIKIGTQNFKIAALVTDDSQQAFDVGPLAPKVFIRSDDLRETGLLQKGSTVTYRYRFKTNLPVTQETVKELNDLIDDNAIRVSSPENSSEQVGRILSYLSDFLGLVGLVALFLSSVGLVYLYRGHLFTKRYSFAILASLGLKRNQIFGVYMRHVLILSLAGTALGLISSGLLIPLINLILSYFLPFELSSVIGARAISIGLLVGIGGVILLSYPLILSALKQKPASLFQEIKGAGKSFDVDTKHFIPYLLFFCSMSVYCAHSLRVGGIFLGIFVGTILGGLFLAFILFFMGNRKIEGGKSSFLTRLSWRYLERYKVRTLSIFIGLLLGSMLLNLIPMLQESINQELDVGRRSDRPSLFLFDIQDEQVADLKKHFDEKEIKLLGLSPFIRARISKVNGVEVKVEDDKALTREQEREQRFRNRGTNLSYRGELTQSETITEGEWFPSDYDESKQDHPFISVEERYASRLGIALGDIVEFSVMGIPVEAKVTNLRKVKWTSFTPNFFIQFQPGVLDDAPKTWIAAIPHLNKEVKNDVQMTLYDLFPNISAVDISQVVSKILEMMGQMGMALKAMSGICVIVGLFVLYSLAHHQMNTRLRDFALLKVVGMNAKDLKKMALREFTSIGLSASFFGALFSIAVANIVSLVFFDGEFVLKIYIPILSVIIISVLCYIIASLAMRRVIKVKASEFLS